jgi:hypothetical protein
VVSDDYGDTVMEMTVEPPSPAPTAMATATVAVEPDSVEDAAVPMPADRMYDTVLVAAPEADTAWATTEGASATMSTDMTESGGEGSEHPSDEMDDRDNSPYGYVPEFRSSDPDVRASMDLTADMNHIHASTQALAGRYDARLRELDRMVSDDVTDFFLVMAHRIIRFDNDKAFQNCSKAAQITRDIDSMELEPMRRKAAESLVKELGVEQIRVMVMLMGSDLFSMAGMLQQGDAAGFPLPRQESAATVSAVLEQNAPNPASTFTEIAYTLPAPSSATSITIYSADGKMAAMHDEGARPAGRQVAKISVGDLTPGTYVYRLKVTTSEGERILSRTMQVVR